MRLFFVATFLVAITLWEIGLCRSPNVDLSPWYKNNNYIKNAFQYDRVENNLRMMNFALPESDFYKLRFRTWNSDNRQCPSELSGKFEGDLMLNKRQQDAIQQELSGQTSTNETLEIAKRWPNRTFIYDIETEYFTTEQIQAILNATEELRSKSCIKFRKRRPNDVNYVTIQGKDEGCYSYVGYHGGAQILNLSPHPVGTGCMTHGSIVHEMLHSLGFFHMQNMHNRDDYVDIKMENIIEGKEINFKKYCKKMVPDFGVPYDYGSVMHYGAYAFSKNKEKTIEPKQSGVTIGQRIGPSKYDILRLRAMYKWKKHNFKRYGKKTVTDFGVSYDYRSVMHYDRTAFSKNGKDTIKPKQSGVSIGQRVGPSSKDILKLLRMYCI